VTDPHGDSVPPVFPLRNAEFGNQFALKLTAYMSASPTNPKHQMPANGATTGVSSSGQSQPAGGSQAAGRDALQALLAFSSLHDQIRRRREGARNSGERTDSAMPSQRFVPDEVLQLISERALAITGADGIAIALAQGDQVRCRASAGKMAPDVGARVDPNSGFSGACFRTGLIIRCDDTEKDPRVDQVACRRIGVRSMVAVPILAEQGAVGLIAAFCRETHGVSDADVRSLGLLAELALEALQPEREFPSSPRLTVREALRRNEPADEQPAEPLIDTTTEAETHPNQENLPNLETLRSTLSPVMQERIPDGATKEYAESVPSLFQEVEAPRRSKGLIASIVALGFLALLLAGATLWWWHSRRAAPAPTRHVDGKTGMIPIPQASAPLASSEALPAVSKDIPTRQIVGIRHWSSADSSTVAIDLQDQVQYEAHRLSNPERIYFDLRDTTLAGGIPGNVEVDDALLSRIRVAQPTADLTRVVLETKSNPDFSVKLENKPYRLLIEIRSASAKPKNVVKIDLFAPLDSQKNKRASSETPEQGTWLAPADSPTRTESAAIPGTGHALRIVLDAGHGGWDMGTVGRKGLLEKDLVLDIVARLGKLVTSRLGAEVVYTRRDDTYVALEKRTETANLCQADLFLSVHANYSDSPNARGVETYYTNTYSSAHARFSEGGSAEALNIDWMNVNIREKVQQSRGLATDVQQALYHVLAAKTPALRNRGVKEASYVVLTGTTMPAILAEVSFVSSPDDEEKLESSTYRQQIAEGLYKGIVTYSEAQRHVNVASASPRVGGQ
jgi:N-acetylmuramoyl-L-alanine amidase